MSRPRNALWVFLAVGIFLVVPLATYIAYAEPLNDAGTARRAAERSGSYQATDTVPIPDPRAVVNAIDYQFMNPEPAKEAWFIMTEVVLGWDDAKQAAWWPFARDVMLGESGFCWNRFRGDEMPFPADGCRQVRQGPHSDAGFGQVTPVLYGRGNLLCVDLGICSKWTVIQDPWTSMLSMIWVMDKLGSQPWCYDARAIAYHSCNRLAPDR